MVCFIAVNAGVEKMYGHSTAEVIGKTLEFLSANGLNDLNRVSQMLVDVFVTGKPQHFEFWGKRKSGEVFPKEIICNRGNYFGKDVIIATARDITERKEAEEKLIMERKLLRTLIDNLPVTIYVKDNECRKIIANRADLDIVGVKTEAEIFGKTDIDSYGFELGQRGYLDDKKVIETGKAVLNREEDFVDIYGHQRWLLTSKIPLTDENNGIIGLVGIGQDITMQKQAQENILKLSKGIEQSPASIEITDTDGFIEYVNPKLCESTGFSPDEIIGKHARILRSDQMPEETYADLWETIKNGGVWKRELLNKKKDGSTFWESVTLTSIKNDKGIITNYIAIKEDITERKKMQTELVLAKEKAEESDPFEICISGKHVARNKDPSQQYYWLLRIIGRPRLRTGTKR